MGSTLSLRQLRFADMVKRFAQFLRSLFSSPPPDADDPRGFSGGVGVREPRKPMGPTSSGSVALEPPPTEARDVWAVGEHDDYRLIFKAPTPRPRSGRALGPLLFRAIRIRDSGF
jgi:hypothetical protein